MNLYLRFYSRGFLFDYQQPLPLPDYQGYDIIESFFLMDSQGKKRLQIPCKNPPMLYRAEVGKMQLNWQIKQWAEGYAEWTVFEYEWKDWYPWMPEWVWMAVENQGQHIRHHKKYDDLSKPPFKLLRT